MDSNMVNNIYQMWFI